MSMNPENEDSDEEWFYNSFNRYDDLLMYDVQGSISCAAFVNGSRLLLATSGGSHHELMELSIPKKLIAGKDAGRTRNRDFSVITAGFTKSLIKRMVPIESGVITSESNGVNYYSVPSSSDDTDIISQKLSLSNDTNDVPLTVAESMVYFGSSLSNIISFDLESEKAQPFPFDSSNLESISKQIESSLLSELTFKCGNLYVCLRDTGHVVMCDPRQNIFANKMAIPKWANGVWTMDISENGSLISTLSSEGALLVYDYRNLSEPSFLSSLEIQEPFRSNSSDHICVQLSPNEREVSVSGLSRNIQIFDFKNNSEGSCLFTHDGHRGEEVQNIVTHLWHEHQDQLVFSADNTGQLQAWRFKVA